MESLVYGSLQERRSILHQIDYAFFARVLDLIATATKQHYSAEELQDLRQYDNALAQLKSRETLFKTKTQLLQREGPLFIHKVLKPLIKIKRRKRKNCVYPGCFKKGLLQLHNHLRQVHKLHDKKERQQWLDTARIEQACR